MEENIGQANFWEGRADHGTILQGFPNLIGVKMTKGRGVLGGGLGHGNVPLPHVPAPQL